MKLALLSGVLFLLGLTGILVCTILRVNRSHIDTRIDYGIILDAGSTSTKAYIYQWQHKTESFLPFVSLSKSGSKDLYTYSVSPGIASLAPNYTHVGDYLEPIITWAKSKIPPADIPTTPIYLQGTGGLRQLSDFSQSTILTSVRYKLQDAGFHFENSNADVLSEVQEAGYGFVAVNTLFNRFKDGKSTDAYGSLDLGGESSAIAYQDSSPPKDYSFTTSINTSVYTVFAQTIDGLGANQARYTFNASLFHNNASNVIDPCAPYGYYENVTTNIGGVLASYMLVGSSNPESCQQLVQDLVNQLTKSLPRPDVGSSTFVVADHYIKLKKFFKLKDNANILELEAKTTSYCGLNYNDAQSHHKKFASEVQNYCFLGLYVATLLEDFYGFDATMRHILWKETVHHQAPVSWTLGYMLEQVALIPKDTSRQAHTQRVRFYKTNSGAVLLFSSVLVCVMAIVLYILQRTRPANEYTIIERVQNVQ